MKIFLKLAVLFMLSAFLIGCATAPQKPMYDWGNYSSALYAYKKTPNKKTFEAYESSLQNIMKQSKKDNLRVPPGVYCEYGYLLGKEGNADAAMKYFALEEQTYPESKVFVERLKAQVEKDKTQEETKE